MSRRMPKTQNNNFPPCKADTVNHLDSKYSSVQCMNRVDSDWTNGVLLYTFALVRFSVSRKFYDVSDWFWRAWHPFKEILITVQCRANFSCNPWLARQAYKII